MSVGEILKRKMNIKILLLRSEIWAQNDWWAHTNECDGIWMQVL